MNIAVIPLNDMFFFISQLLLCMVLLDCVHGLWMPLLGDLLAVRLNFWPVLELQDNNVTLPASW